MKFDATVQPQSSKTSKAVARRSESKAQTHFAWEQGPSKSRLQELVNAGCNKAEVESFLIVLRLFAAAPKQRKNTFLPRGMTAKVLKDLPSRIEKLGEEVHRVNEHILFKPEIWLHELNGPQPLVHPLKARVFMAVPDILKQYAKYLLFRTTLLGRFRQGPGKIGISKRYLIRVMMKYVQKATGEPFYEALADLLSTALPNDPTYDGSALRKLDIRAATAPTRR